jgi:hypothetical protein
VHEKKEVMAEVIVEKNNEFSFTADVIEHLP